jgi:hypothetical protein
MLDVCKTIIALTNCANRGLMADDRYLEIGTEIFRSITDEIKEWPEAKPIITDWSNKLMEYLCSNFKDLEASHKAHPSLLGKSSHLFSFNLTRVSIAKLARAVFSANLK